MQWVQTRHATQSLWLELSSWFCWENLTFRSSHMDHTTYFSVEESTVYASQLNKRKLATVGIEGTDKFCVKQQIYSYISPQKSVLICQGLCQTASRWMTVIKWLCQRTSIISLMFPCLKLTMTSVWTLLNHETAKHRNSYFFNFFSWTPKLTKQIQLILVLLRTLWHLHTAKKAE